MDDSARDWRPLVAALANPNSRKAMARLMLGASLDEALEDLPSARRDRVAELLRAAGVVDDATGEFDAAMPGKLLAAHSAPPRRGLDRFLDGGRITQYPASAEDRASLLAFIAGTAFAVGEVLAEREVNDRLAPLTDDVAVLRRYLVDHELLERRADGSEYALVDAATEPPMA